MHHNKQEQDVNPFQRLQQIVRTLRSDGGCPWDRKQTPQTLKKYLLEEAAELAEAVELGDPQHICEEIGDLYFILALLTTVFEEQSSFSADDALHLACEKMVRRHPHVFAASSNDPPLSEQQLREQWEQIKKEEKKARTRQQAAE
ncbi:MAG: MazG nucleotide pyrophosphohydrolase domain-containing protein [Candidatus Electrothrix sp. YB6]